MSHTVEKDVDSETGISDLTALQAAALRCKMVFKNGQKTYQHYSRIPGECEHAIGLPAEEAQRTNTAAYEIGVVPKTDGRYALQYDPYGGAIDSRAGIGLENLLAYYQLEAARNQAQNLGDIYSEQQLPDGSWVAEIDTTARLGV
jgi:hypothetical protein